MNSDPIHPWLDDELNHLEQKNQRRRLRALESPQGAHITIHGRRMINFGSNNYLGLANHPEVIAEARASLEQWGFGAGASRLVTGHCRLHETLESKLATFKRTQAALVFPTGYQANLAAVRSLLRRQDVVLLDKLNHASIIDAARGSDAIVRVFGHRDYDRLEALLARNARAPRRMIVTDSLFSMDGDMADLPRLVELKKRYDALLVIDEAHATGVFGDGGRGVAEMMNVEEDIDVTAGTLSKGLGGIGGFIAGRRTLIDWIINTAGAFIYTTALPPVACAAALAALRIVDGDASARRALLERAEKLRAGLTARGWNTGDSISQIIPVLVGDNERVMTLARRLEEAGLLVPAIRPPTVKRGQARLRISLCTDHCDDDIQQLVEALGEATQN